MIDRPIDSRIGHHGPGAESANEAQRGRSKLRAGAWAEPRRGSVWSSWGYGGLSWALAHGGLGWAVVARGGLGWALTLWR